MGSRLSGRKRGAAVVAALVGRCCRHRGHLSGRRSVSQAGHRAGVAGGVGFGRGPVPGSRSDEGIDCRCADRERSRAAVAISQLNSSPEPESKSARSYACCALFVCRISGTLEPDRLLACGIALDVCRAEVNDAYTVALGHEIGHRFSMAGAIIGAGAQDDDRLALEQGVKLRRAGLHIRNDDAIPITAFEVPVSQRADMNVAAAETSLKLLLPPERIAR